MGTGTTESRTATVWHTVRPPDQRRPALWRAGVLFSLFALASACTDITRPNEPARMTPPALNISRGEGPKVATDKQDYYPGETVAIDGFDWTPGETVRLQVAHEVEGDNDAPEHQPWQVTADENGYFSATWVVPVEGDEDGATLKLTADGVTSLAHAEVIFTDLDGTVNLFSDAGYTIAQNAFSWNATVRPRIVGPKKSTCYRITWTDPSGDVFYGFGETSDPAPATLDLPVRPTGAESGKWNVVVGQRAAGSCESQTSFSSATHPIYFDVARSVVIGAGTSGTTDSPGGDQCVYSNSNVGSGSGFCQNPASVRLYVGRSSANQLHSYVRFDLTTASPAIPAGMIVTDAKVRLVAGGWDGARDYAIQRADATWAEGTINYAGQPGTTGASTTVPMVTTGVPGAGGGDPQTWMKWDVDADVQAFLDGTTNHGWRISDVTAATSTQFGMFFTTEATDGCAAGVTTCKRKWPVLLIDYVEPPKLEFYTTAFTGVVGQCLGPIQVESKTFAGVALPVGSDLTVNLTALSLGTGAAGTAGAGAFYSNSGCTTGTTTTLITTGNSISQSFYYKASHRGDGTHDVKASATGYTPDPVQTQTINFAPSTNVYTGDLILLVGSTLHMSAVIGPYPECAASRRVLFRMEPDPTSGTEFDDLTGFNDFGGFAVTNPGGVATKSTGTTGWPEGLYELTVNAIGNDDCLAQKAVPNPIITVIRPGAAATGGGFLAGNLVGGGRVNFGFTVRAVEGTSDPIQYKGQFLLMKQEGGVPLFRCKGYLDTYGSVPETTPQRYAASGKCDFQLWDPALDGGNGDWYVPVGSGYLDQTFTIYFVDNGSGRGKEAPPPDQFGFNVGFVGSAIANPSFSLLDIKGGNIDVKDSGTTVTGTKGGGKKG